MEWRAAGKSGKGVEPAEYGVREMEARVGSKAKI